MALVDATPVEHLLREDWDWRALCDYVVREIERRHGRVTREGLKESIIFKDFLRRWGVLAKPIALYAFEGPPNGIWRNEPIALGRFTKGNDPHFSAIIAQYLTR